MIKKFKKKPVIIEAMQFDDGDAFELRQWLIDNGVSHRFECIQGDNVAHCVGHYFVIETLEGNMQADHGDWIIKGIQGEFYPCKPDIFADSYEEVESA